MVQNVLSIRPPGVPVSHLILFLPRSLASAIHLSSFCLSLHNDSFYCHYSATTMLRLAEVPTKPLSQRASGITLWMMRAALGLCCSGASWWVTTPPLVYAKCERVFSCCCRWLKAVVAWCSETPANHSGELPADLRIGIPTIKSEFGLQPILVSLERSAATKTLFCLRAEGV